ncbi:hypothetical protein L6452_14266 [Arctium lappa]|uniref:Uncharacterized protein n=1 Tax=Arctium lappa TaxID=4217 RepID=A0ACB9CKY4_ARCLA|nr:hypothetical protein L6452_14266 [Arctium lappa]
MDKMKLLLDLSASGLRAIRYAREMQGIRQVVALDNDNASVEACRRNIKFNGSVASEKVESNLADARVYMLTYPKEFDVIDLDPYGSPSMFLDSAVQSIAGGMLMCTTTNMQDQNPNHTMQDNLDDESEETVSLCDLPIYGYNTVYSTSDSEDTMKADETFEFFSEDWVKNDKDSNFFPPKDIVFCGNLIPPKQPISRNTPEFKKLRDHGSNKVDPNYSGGGKNREFAKLISMNKGRNHGVEREPKRVFPVSGSKKSRWYNYGVGLAGIPTEMELSAIRSRQNQHRKNRLEGTHGGGGKEGGGFRRGKGLGRLIRDLSCNDQNQANSMVKESLVCIPRLKQRNKGFTKPRSTKNKYRRRHEKGERRKEKTQKRKKEKMQKKKWTRLFPFTKSKDSQAFVAVAVAVGEKGEDREEW